MSEGRKLASLRVERERTVEALSSCYANDLIDIHEFERRVDLAERADNVAALETLTADLRLVDIAGPDEYRPDQALVPASTNQISNDVPDANSLYCVLGGVSKKGAWRVPRRLNVWALMGGAELDLREAVLGPGVSEIRINAMMGGAEVIVPPGLDVEMDGAGILGGFEDAQRSHSEGGDPDRPRVRITGVAFMGGVELSERYPGESSREARRRRRRQKKELRKKQKAELRGERKRRQLSGPEDGT